MSEALNATDRDVDGLAGFKKYYDKNRERLLQQQRERRERPHADARTQGAEEGLRREEV